MSSKCSKLSETMDEFRNLGKIVQSPLDPNEYRLIQLCSNGLKCLLISTSCKASSLDVNSSTCAVRAVEYFNEKYLGIPREKGEYDDKPVIDSIFESTSKGKARKKGSDCKDESRELLNINFLCGSGCLHDPEDIQGMSHLCEHAVFLGSENHPDSNNLEHLLQRIRVEGTDTNAHTSLECTTYGLILPIDHVEEGLDILTDSLTNPIMDEESVELELELLESEFQWRKLKEVHRYFYFLQTQLARKGHPMGNFLPGCKKTMKVKDLGKRAKEWVRYNFTGRNMVLSLKGPLTMKRLEDLAIKYGSRIRSCNCDDPPRITIDRKFKTVEPFDIEERWNKVYYIPPYTPNDRCLRLSWLLPKQAAHNHTSKPLKFLMYLFRTKVKGSLDYFLREKEWILDIFSWSDDNYAENRFRPIFLINLKLTDKGLVNRRNVLQAVFSYIKMLEESPAEALLEVFNDMKQNAADYFHYKSDQFVNDPSVTYNMDDEIYIQEIGEGLLNGVDPAEILTSVYLVRRFEEDLFRQCVKSLNIDNTNVILGGPEVAYKYSETADPETPLGIRYCRHAIKDETKIEIRKITANKFTTFKLPGKNIHVSTKNICHLPVGSSSKTYPQKTDVVKVQDEKMHIVCTTLCEKGFLPTAEYEVRLESHAVDNLAVPNVISIIPMMDVWIRCLKHKLDKLLAPVHDSLISYDIKHQNPCLAISLRGPSHRLPSIMEIILNVCLTHCCPKTFKMMTAAVKIHYEKMLMNTDHFFTDLVACTIREKYFTLSEKLEHLEILDFDLYEDFLNDFRTNLYVKVKILGCFTSEDVDKMEKLIRNLDYLTYSRVIGSLVPNRALMIPKGERCMQVNGVNPNDECAQVYNYYQIGLVDFETDVMIKAIVGCLNNIAYDQLRTKLVLGYDVKVDVDECHGVTGIAIHIGMIQYCKFTTEYVDEMIDKFLCWFFWNIMMKKEEYTKYIANAGEVKDEDGTVEVAKWSQKEAVSLVANYLLSTGKYFRKFSTHLIPKKQIVPNKDRKKGCCVEFKTQKNKHYRVTNLDNFKFSCDCYPSELTEENAEDDDEDNVIDEEGVDQDKH